MQAIDTVTLDREISKIKLVNRPRYLYSWGEDRMLLLTMQFLMFQKCHPIRWNV